MLKQSRRRRAVKGLQNYLIERLMFRVIRGLVDDDDDYEEDDDVEDLVDGFVAVQIAEVLNCIGKGQLRLYGI
jgi:hypothetical protein